MGKLWSVFILALAAGFLTIYFGDKCKKSALFSAGLLGAIGIVILALILRLTNFWPVLVMIIGLILIISQYVPSRDIKKED